MFLLSPCGREGIGLAPSDRATLRVGLPGTNSSTRGKHEVTVPSGWSDGNKNAETAARRDAREVEDREAAIINLSLKKR